MSKIIESIASCRIAIRQKSSIVAWDFPELQLAFRLYIMQQISGRKTGSYTSCGINLFRYPSPASFIQSLSKFSENTMDKQIRLCIGTAYLRLPTLALCGEA